MIARAGFWHRAAAWSIDAAICASAVAIAAGPRLAADARALDERAFDLFVQAYGAMARHGLADGVLPDIVPLSRDEGLQVAMSALQADIGRMLTPPVLAFALAMLLLQMLGERSAWGGGPGKRALRLRVRRHDGAPAGLARLFARQVAGLASWATLNVGHLMALGPRRLALHDRLSGTCVLRGRPGPLPRWARAWLGLQMVAAGLATAWLAIRLASRGADAARQVFG